MLIIPEDLQPDPLEIDETVAPGGIDYAMDVRQAGPLHITGLAERIEEHRGPKEAVEDIRLRAEFRGEFELLCARCLQSIPRTVEERFDLIFRPSGVDAESGERSISEAETEIGYYEQSGLSLEDVVREQVLLSLPDRSLCREDCKGICPKCGGNKNETACGCEEKILDSRWGALQSFSTDLKPGSNAKSGAE